MVHPALDGLLAGLTGYRYDGVTPGVHVGMPSPDLTLVLALDGELRVSWPGLRDPPAHFDIALAGLHDRPVHVHHGGSQEGIQLDLTPAGARELFGCPAAVLALSTVELQDLLGPPARQLRERLAGEPDWSRRFALVQAFLLARADRGTEPAGPGGRAGRRPPPPEVAHAWRLLRRSAGRMPVGLIADEVGWSARHLTERFRAEYGLAPKTTARVARFDRSRHLLRRPGARVADVAHACGYADQAHLTREWQRLAGTTPTRWWAQDQLAFVQDEHSGGEGR